MQKCDFSYVINILFANAHKIYHSNKNNKTGKKVQRRYLSLTAIVYPVSPSQNYKFRGGSGAAATFKMECFTKHSVLDVARSILDDAAALDPPLQLQKKFQDGSSVIVRSQKSVRKFYT